MTSILSITQTYAAGDSFAFGPKVWVLHVKFVTIKAFHSGIWKERYRGILVTVSAGTSYKENGGCYY